MEITTKVHDKVTVVSISGSIDAMTADEVTDFLSKCIAQKQLQLVLDLGAVEFMSSSGIRSIMQILKEVHKIDGGDLRLAAAQPGVTRVLTMSGIIDVLQSFPATDEAVSSFGA